MPDNQNLAQNDPKTFFKKYSHNLIIDEVQNIPELFSYIQVLVDENPRKGNFILTVSQNFILLEKISQSLAGRTYIYTLLPLSLNELKENNKYKNIESIIYKGCYPKLYSENIDAKLIL